MLQARLRPSPVRWIKSWLFRRRGCGWPVVGWGEMMKPLFWMSFEYVQRFVLVFFIVEIYVYTYIHTVFWRRVSAPWTGAPLPHRTLAWTNGILESLKAWVPWMNMLPLPISNAYEGLDSACYMQRSRCQVCCQIRCQDRNRPGYPAGCFSTYFDFSGKDDAAAQHATDWNIFSSSVAVFCQNSPWSPIVHELESDAV